MAYCGIMRIEKRKGGAISGICTENTRTEADRDKKHFDKSDVDWDRTNLNLDMTVTKDKNGELQVEFSSHKEHGHWKREYNQLMQSAKEQGMKIRKDSNAMIDGLYTASDDFWKDKLTETGELTEDGKRFFADCLKEHVRLYCQGDPTRVHGAVIHLDEATPHLHCNSDCVYEDEKGLHWSADKICGNKFAYQSRQDRFYDDVTKEWGLQRADERNIDQETGEYKRPEKLKKHQSVQEYKEQKAAETYNKALTKARHKAAQMQKADQVIEKKQKEIEGLNNIKKDADKEAIEAQNRLEDIRTGIYTSLGREDDIDRSRPLSDDVADLERETAEKIKAKETAEKEKQEAEKQAVKAKEQAEKNRQLIEQRTGHLSVIKKVEPWIKKKLAQYKESKLHKGMRLVPEEDLKEYLYTRGEYQEWEKRQQKQDNKLMQWQEKLDQREKDITSRESQFQLFGRFEPAQQKLDRLRKKYPEQMAELEKKDQASGKKITRDLGKWEEEEIIR